jgi:hypothetical protein
VRSDFAPTLAAGGSMLDNYNYYSDFRVINAKSSASFLENCDLQKMVYHLIIDDGEGEETCEELPLKMEVCPTCAGTGRHVDPSVDSGGYYSDCEDEKEYYFSGGYSICCQTCHGRNVVPTIDRKAANKAALAIFDRKAKDDSDFLAECLAELRHGA